MPDLQADTQGGLSAPDVRVHPVRMKILQRVYLMKVVQESVCIANRRQTRVSLVRILIKKHTRMVAGFCDKCFRLIWYVAVPSQHPIDSP